MRPEPMASATLAAAEKLQTSLGQTSYAGHFVTFVPLGIRQQITLRMKAMKRLLDGHPEFKSGTTLKTITELSLEEFLKLMRLIFGTEATDLASAQQQILRAFHGKNLSFENYFQLETACLSTLQTAETYAIPPATQRNIIHQLVKQMRADHPEGHTYHDEAKAIIDAVMASDTALKSLDAFTEDILTQLCDNKTMFAAAVERGIFRPNIPKKRTQPDAPDEEPAEKRHKGSCFACGRQGHKKQDCSFLEQGHPDANTENYPWPESTNGKAWALKGKSSLPGNITLSGETFNYQVNRK